MRVLIIDNNIDRPYWGSAELAAFARALPGVTVTVRRAPQDDLPAAPDPFDRIIVSGSKTSAMEDAPWIERLHRFISRTLDLGKPFLGVCYGHQTLARVLHGGSATAVRKAQTPEFGWTEIELLETSPLFTGLPPKFYSYSSHFDEVCVLAPGMRRLARSADCEVQACQYGDLPVFGIQFHPEKGLESAKKSLAERKKKGEPKRLLLADRSEELFDPKVGELIFGNFLKL